MRRTPFEKATLVRGAAARKTFGVRLFRPRRVKFFVAPANSLMASRKLTA
jgi:hypothetical protein